MRVEAPTCCDICADYDGHVYTIAEASGILPEHPNCGGTWVAAPGTRKLPPTAFTPAKTLDEAKRWAANKGMKVGTKIGEMTNILADAHKARFTAFNVWEQGITTRAEFMARWEKILIETQLKQSEALKVLNGVNKAIAEGTAQANEYLIIRGQANNKWLKESVFQQGFYKKENKVLTMLYDDHWYDLAKRQGILSKLSNADAIYKNQWQGVYTHEYGHAVHWNNPSILNRSKQALAKLGKENVEGMVSSYARENAKELAAECYTLIKHPDFYKLSTERKNLIEWIIKGTGGGP